VEVHRASGVLYTLGGYQVIKKWLSYRERAVLRRALKPDEAATSPR
jgi:hypothetical protein